MNPALVVLGVLVLGAVGGAANSIRLQRKRLVKLRDAWGKTQPVRRLDDERVAEAWRELHSTSEDHFGIDARTWEDLDLDSVFATIDRTHTGLGRQMLYARMHSEKSWNETPAIETLTRNFSDNPTLRETVGMQLQATGRLLGFGLWAITRSDLIVVRWWYWGFPILALLMITSLVAVVFKPAALIAIVGLFVVNMIVRMATAWQIPELLTPMRQMGPLIHTAERLARQNLNDPSASGEIAEDVARLRPLKRIAQWVSRDPISSGDLIASLWEYLNLLFILDANALLFSAHHLKRLGPTLRRTAAWVGDVDVALSVAALRAEPKMWTIPVWSGTGHARGAGAWHPLVESPVMNDVDLQSGSGIVITGANMSGKSTYLRTIGIAAVLARAINTCPAKTWEGRPFRVRSLIGRNDDLSTGKSYYQVEADGVVALLRDAEGSEATLFLLDELLRGTNTIERLAAGEAVLRALLDGHDGASPHVVVVATHDGELVTMLEDRYVPFHFRETIGPGGLTFDYLRRTGPASTRTAIALLESTGAPASVVAAARARAEVLDAARLRTDSH